MVCRKWIPKGDKVMRYEFNDSYLLNKKDIEKGTNFDKNKFFGEIKLKLLNEGLHVDKDFYLGNTEVIEGLCLYEDCEFWVVSYFERRRKFSPAFFVDPYDAALFLAAKLKKWPRNLN
jgi:hypothetical protein